MSNRIFCFALSAILFALSIPVEAQQAGKVYRIGYLHTSSTRVARSADAFRQGMRELGYVEGENYVLEIRTRETKTDRLSEFAAELIALKVDIILAAGSRSLRAAKEATSLLLNSSAAFPEVLSWEEIQWTLQYAWASLTMPTGVGQSFMRLSRQLRSTIGFLEIRPVPRGGSRTLPESSPTQAIT